jgi:hypothetical protein
MGADEVAVLVVNPDRFYRPAVAKRLPDDVLRESGSVGGGLSLYLQKYGVRGVGSPEDASVSVERLAERVRVSRRRLYKYLPDDGTSLRGLAAEPDALSPPPPFRKRSGYAPASSRRPPVGT